MASEPPRLDEVTVRRVAHRARLRLSDEQVALFTKQLASVHSYIEQLDELDTTDVPPMAHALELTNVLRQDVTHPTWSAQTVLGNAPRRRDGYFQVPKVLDRKST